MILIRKKGGNILPYKDKTGIEHDDAVIKPVRVINDVSSKTFEIIFKIFPDVNSISPEMALDEFNFKFDEHSNKPSIYADDEKTQILEWGYPSYNEVFYYINVNNKGISVTNPIAGIWLLETLLINEENINKKASIYWEYLK